MKILLLAFIFCIDLYSAFSGCKHTEALPTLDRLKRI